MLGRLQKLIREIAWICGPLFLALVLYCVNLTEQLTASKEHIEQQRIEIQKKEKELGLSQSQLLSFQELSLNTKEDLDKLSQELQNLLRKHNLEIKSKDNTIARLTSSVIGGESKATVQENPNGTVRIPTFVSHHNNDDRLPIISYEWKDPHGRFHLLDPNIWKQGDETFHSNQHFRIKGLVFETQNGDIQTKQIQVEEVVKQNDQWKKLLDSKTEVVESEFLYTNQKNEKKKPSFFCLNLLTLLTTFLQ